MEKHIMKTIGVRALRENPGVLSQSAALGECVLLTNRNTPISLAIPFDERLLNAGVHLDIALKLYEDNALTLVKASKVAGLSVERFMENLEALNIEVVDQSEGELQEDLSVINE
jgi:predicted HTH domain antitoxin